MSRPALHRVKWKSLSKMRTNRMLQHGGSCLQSRDAGGECEPHQVAPICPPGSRIKPLIVAEIQNELLHDFFLIEERILVLDQPLRARFRSLAALVPNKAITEAIS